MRNLKLLKCVQMLEVQNPGSPRCVSVRIDTDTILIASQLGIIEHDPRTGQVLNEVSLTTENYLPEDGSGVVLGIQDLPDQESACVATAQGDVILWNLNTNQLECVGSVDSGLTAMSWSPDQELVALCTGQETIILMTKDFEPITEVAIQQEEFGEGARKVRVWNRECVLQATSEVVNGLEEALGWKPSGSLIACAQRLPNKYSVVFMEKNGLLHGDFTLPFAKDQVKVKELLWNCDSTVLAVWLEDLTPEVNSHPNTYIQLWTVGNYHWYLKQSLHFGREASKAPACLCWDPVKPLCLYLLTHDWSTYTYDWGWSTDRSQGCDSHDNANVAVIDGDKVLVTTFRQCVVPPPMCSYELQFPAPVNLVTFNSQPLSTNEFAALTTDGFLHITGRAGEDAIEDAIVKDACGFRIISKSLVVQKTYSVAVAQEGVLSLRLLLWLKEDVFLAIACGKELNQSRLLVLTPAETQSSELRLDIRSEVKVEGHVINMCHSSKSDTLALQLDDGQIRRVNWDPAEITVTEWKDSSESIINFPQPCVHTALCSINGEEYLVGLTERSHLYIDMQEALSSEAAPNDESVRRVERGSRIVTVVPQDTRVILQMPRGNLETIHHRALVLAQVRNMLNELKFRDAFNCMRKLRINLNLIYDHNPGVFLENAELFLRQIASVTHINLFLTELKDEDTTKTMYPCLRNSACQTASVTARGGQGRNKVDVVCDALRSAMEILDPHTYCLCILTSHVRKTTPELEIALQKVHELRVNPPSAENAVSAEEALNYLLFLVNVNELYEHSLGTYDFDLVLMVAEKSQKDPKEYLSFLNLLKTLEPNYQRYTIDKHLKRYKKALHHLSKCGEEHFTELLNLVKDQKLYTEALQLYPTDSQQYKALSVAYAEHLLEDQQAEQAGLLLWRCGEMPRALQAFVSCTSWRHALAVATNIPVPPTQLTQLARDLAEKLLEVRRHTEAALLLEQYAKDCEEAISALIEGAAWEEALRLIYLYNRPDIIETNLKPALLEAHGTQIAFVDSQKALFTRHKNRLAVVREQKEKARLEFGDEDGPDCADAELYSEASSIMTGSRLGSRYSHSNSRVSSRSSKNRRKAEGKKHSLKEGSPFEDIALLYAITQIIHVVDKMREEIHSLLKALVLFQFDKLASSLQSDYNELLQLIDAGIPEIWHEGIQQSQTPITGPNSTANSIMASLQQPRSVTVPQQDAEILTPPKLRQAVKWKLSILE
ncbi:Elongator complex protein 1 [Bagarius yarrelli]|uniref:Elongator complex protein 1 n=1 Tax=Bagarius yarrelli TaxID=175774 RepID=A0A556TRM9_BAGYA|nr:Elongator complex protein 1 [Bagarius yarrelli]